MERALLLIVAKAPLPGITKTRLGATIGMDRAAALYAAFLVDLAARFSPSPDESWDFAFGWAFTPAELDFGQVLEKIGCRRQAPSVLFVPQVGDRLDIRLVNLFRWGGEHGYERIIIIASDSPQLTRATVREAITALTGHEVALGRTHDGGYYLIGMRGFYDVITDTPMSTIAAADALVARAAAQGLSVAELPETFDVDEESDLRHLRDELAPDGVAAPATWAALHQLGLADRDRDTGEPTG